MFKREKQMKLKFKVSYVDEHTGTVSMYPLDCGLEGTLVYTHLAARAVAQFNLGDVVDAEISLPSRYPLPGTQGHHKQHGNGKTGNQIGGPAEYAQSTR